MDFYEVIKTRRSIRSYADTPIPDDVLGRVLDAARVAPSGSNRQPWRFIVVTDPDLKQAIVPIIQNQPWVATAPAIIVACGCNIHYNRGDWMGDYAVILDVALAMDHLILAARAEGLGTCWIGSFSNDQAKALLGVPADWQVVGFTPLGYPKGEVFTAQTERKPLQEIVSYNRW